MSFSVYVFESINKVQLDEIDGDEYLFIDVNSKFWNRFGLLNKKFETGFYSYIDDDLYHSSSDLIYRRWKTALTNLIGFDDVEHCRILSKYNNEFQYPFKELILFSSRFGYIGSNVSEKLYNDFIQFDNNAKKVNHFNFYSTYKSLKRAFEKASNNGLVMFNYL